MHAKEADKEPAAASVFVLVYQQLRQYLYFCTSQPGGIEGDISMSFSIEVSGSRDRTSTALSETFGGGARSTRRRPAGVAGAAGAAGLGGGSCIRTSKSLSETFKPFFSSDGSGSRDRISTGLSETSAGAKSSCRCPCAGRGWKSCATLAPREYDKFGEALSVELRTSFILRPGVLCLRPLAKAVSFAAVKSLPEELVKRLLLIP